MDKMDISWSIWAINSPISGAVSPLMLGIFSLFAGFLEFSIGNPNNPERNARGMPVLHPMDATKAIRHFQTG
jgi:hypothetical protein